MYILLTKKVMALDNVLSGSGIFIASSKFTGCGGQIAPPPPTGCGSYHKNALNNRIIE